MIMSLQKINSTKSIKGLHNALRAIDLTQIKDSERFSEAVCIRVGKILNLGVEYAFEVQQIGLAMLPSLRAIYSARKNKRNPLDTFGIQEYLYYHLVSNYKEQLHELV